jgi:hypothetical protein
MELVTQALSEPRGGGGGGASPAPHEGAASRSVAPAAPGWVARLYLGRPPYTVALLSAAVGAAVLLLLRPLIIFPHNRFSPLRSGFAVAAVGGASALVLAWRHFKP